MHWLQLHIQLNASPAVELEQTLIACGAASVTLRDNKDQPILEPAVGETPLWDSVRVTGLFDNQTDISSLTPRLQQQFDLSMNDIQLEYLEDRDWERAWLEHFKPLQCGRRLWICPNWESPPASDAVNVFLDPGLAFGTGTHETTLLCLQWLDAAELDGLRVLDFGCGSGILGIAALLLGARQAVFVDNDPQALIATQANLAKNGIARDRFQLVDATAYPERFLSSRATNAGFELVLANILAGPLIDLAPDLLQSLIPEGRLVLSGLQSSQQALVSDAYNHALNFEAAAIMNDWVRLTGIKGVTVHTDEKLPFT